MGLTEDRIQQALVDYENREFSPKEQAALRYAEMLTRDEKQVGDVEYQRLREHFTEAEIVELGVFIALCNGFDKLISTWALSPTVCEVPQPGR